MAVGDPRVRALFGSPKVTTAQLAELITGVAGELDERSRNFLALVAESKRLPFLPEIAQIFDALKAMRSGWVDVHIAAAIALPEAEAAQLTAALEKRFDRKVRVETSVDPSLIGGAVVRAGDLTIDGSLKARLVRLAQDLVA